MEHNIKVSLASKGKNLEVAVEMIKNPEELNDSRLIAFISCVPADQIQDRENAAIVSCSEQLEEFGELLNGLKESLAKRIATYMIPTFFVPLTAMPLNASAKTDRKHLRGLVSDLGFSQLADFALSSRKEIQPPQTAMEKLLHNMWCSVLALPPDSFGVEADFFETGKMRSVYARILGKVWTDIVARRRQHRSNEARIHRSVGKSDPCRPGHIRPTEARHAVAGAGEGRSTRGGRTGCNRAFLAAAIRLHERHRGYPQHCGQAMLC